MIRCNPSDHPTQPSIDKLAQSGLTQSELQDRILGMLVGSAIGDAMGAPTEMWPREAIRQTYGFVKQLDPMIREVSPEGIWLPNLPAGGTTDDTRWKVLAANFMLTQEAENLDSREFARKILSQHQAYLDKLSDINSKSALPYKSALLQVEWLQEWAKVSAPYSQDNLRGYVDSLGKFYGGEMVCAGLLYAPVVGAFFPGNPEKAYSEAYKLSIFDLGYAKDLSALSASLTAAAMKKGATADSILAVIRVDPNEYYSSRLVGRVAHHLHQTALSISDTAHGLDSLDNPMDPESPAMIHAFAQLDQRRQDMPFHAGEIYLQALTAMIYTDFDFLGSLIFLTNYGRDNDTTAALAGAILGALYGYDRLPEKEKNQVMDVSRNHLGIDLLKTGDKLAEHLSN